jgi:hypothetical protein
MHKALLQQKQAVSIGGERRNARSKGLRTR